MLLVYVERQQQTKKQKQIEKHVKKEKKIITTKFVGLFSNANQLLHTSRWDQ